MQKLIPLIYFYTVSLAGLGLLIVGVFADVHFLVNKLSYSEYPLPYLVVAPCVQPEPPMPIMMQGSGVTTNGTVSSGAVTIEKGVVTKTLQPVPSGAPTIAPVQITSRAVMPNFFYANCEKQTAEERKQAEVADLEKALSFTLVGLILFSIHFYYARKKSQ